MERNLKKANKIEKDKTKKTRKRKIIEILFTGLIMAFGLFLLKYIPMSVYGESILFDASAHLTSTIFILYLIYQFIRDEMRFKIPYYLFSFLVLNLMAVYRIIENEHNDVGLILGLVVSTIAIIIPRWSELKNIIDF